MNKDSRVNIARKVLQDGKLPVDEVKTAKYFHDVMLRPLLH